MWVIEWQMDKHVHRGATFLKTYKLRIKNFYAIGRIEALTIMFSHLNINTVVEMLSE